MPAIEELRCPTCGAALAVPAGETRAACAYCGSLLTVERDHGEIVAFATGEVIGAIRDEGQQSRDTLDRMRLEQRRSEVETQVAMARSQLTTLDAELWALGRGAKRNGLIGVGQMFELRQQRREVDQRLKQLKADSQRLDALLYPQAVESKQPLRPQAVETEQPPRPQARRNGITPGMVISALIVLLIVGYVVREANNQVTAERQATTIARNGAIVTTGTPTSALAVPPARTPQATATTIPTSTLVVVTPTPPPVAIAPSAIPTTPTTTGPPLDEARTAELTSFLNEGFTDATWFKHIVGVQVYDNRIFVQTDFPQTDAGKRSAAPVCGAVSGYAVGRGIPNWEVLVYGDEKRILIYRHNIGERC